MEVKKGEEFEWVIENKNLCLLKRCKKLAYFKRKK